MRQPKEVTIKDQRFQIGLMDATTGSWIAMQILTKIFPFGLEQLMKIDPEKMQLPADRAELTEKEFRNIQLYCLKVVKRFEKQPNDVTVAMPIMTEVGQWAAADLQYDVVAVLTLTAHALIFNVVPFFEEGALNPLLESLKELSQFNAPTT